MRTRTTGRTSTSGGTITDGPLSYGDGVDPTITGAAYTNNDNVAATGTELFDIDRDLGTLALQSPPNAGTLVTRGPLLAEESKGFRNVGLDTFSERDASGAAVTNVTYAVLGKGGTEKLYTVDRTTGAATPIGPFGRQGIADLAVPIG